jgi:hypothetical protein
VGRDKETARRLLIKGRLLPADLQALKTVYNPATERQRREPIAFEDIMRLTQ